MDAASVVRAALRCVAWHLLAYACIACAMVPVTLGANQLGHDPSADLIRLATLPQRATKAAMTVWFCLGKV